MNPFDLSGPQFLMFYVVFVVAVYVLIHFCRLRAENAYPPDSSGLPTDPYEIAFLRGGRPEVVRLATFTLVERRILRVSADNTIFHVADPAAAGLVREPIEKAITHAVGNGGAASHLLKNAPLHLEPFEEKLKRQRLLPDNQIQTARLMVIGLGLVLLLTVAGVKVAVALARGRTNIGFLIVMALAAGGILTMITFRRLTVHGERVVADLKSLFERLRSRAGIDMDAAELALFAAVFGMGPVAVSYPWVGRVYQKAAAGDGSSCGAASSCGSGSSCGGGCGGGCGGCGG